jgi:hypothetical protein
MIGAVKVSSTNPPTLSIISLANMSQRLSGLSETTNIGILLNSLNFRRVIAGASTSEQIAT